MMESRFLCFHVSFPLLQRLLSFVDWSPFVVVPIDERLMSRLDDTSKEKTSLQT
jgi:hypothetical protein